MEKEKDFAINYIRNEERYYKLRHIYLCSEKGEASLLKDKVNIKIEEIKQQLTSIEGEVKNKQDVYVSLVSEIKKTMKEFNVCDGYCKELDEKFKEYEREDISKRQNLNHHLELDERLKGEIERLKEKKEQNINTLAELKNQLPIFEDEWEKLSKEKNEKKTILVGIEKNIEAKTKELRDKKKALEEELKPKELEYNKYRDEKAAFKIELDTIEKRRKGYLDEKDRVESRIQEFNSKLHKIFENIREITQKEKANTEKITEYQNKNSELKSQKEELELKINKKSEILEVAKA